MKDVRNQQKKLLSIGEASEYLNVSIDTLRRWEKKEKVKSLRSPGGHRYFAVSELDTLFGKKYERTQESNKDNEAKDSLHEEKTTPRVESISENKNATSTENKLQEVENKVEERPVEEVKTIEERPSREILIPRVQPVQVSFGHSSLQEAYIEQQKISILTPTFVNNDEKFSEKPKNLSKKNLTLIFVGAMAGALFAFGLGYVVYLALRSSDIVLSPIP
jgi:excisionase family DNA binding protein